MSTDGYTYSVKWSAEDGEQVGLCAEFPSLSWLANTPEEALAGIRQVVARIRGGSARQQRAHTVTTYETDIAAWARVQAALLLAGRFDVVDIVHVADEVLDVAKAEENDLAGAVEALLVSLAPVAP